MLYDRNASAIVHAAPGTKVMALGVVLCLGGCAFIGFGLFLNCMSAELFGDTSTVDGLVSAFKGYGLLCCGAGAVLLLVALVIALREKPARKLRNRIAQGLFDPRYGNPLSLADGELLPNVQCAELEPGVYELTVSALASTVDAVAQLGPSISSRLCGHLSNYAVTRTSSDDAQNLVRFRIEDVTVDRQLIVEDVRELTPDEPFLLAVQQGLSLDLATSGSILVAGKTRSGKTTGVLSLLLQVLSRGPDEHGFRSSSSTPSRRSFPAPHMWSRWTRTARPAESWHRCEGSQPRYRNVRPCSTTSPSIEGTPSIGGRPG